MNRIAILGSTGSIGKQTLDVVRNDPDMKITALAARVNADLLERQVREFRPPLAVLFDERAADDLRVRIADTGTRVLSGMEGLIEAASAPDTDVVVTAFVGMNGIRPTIAAIDAGKNIALANKETLVTAGHLIVPLAKTTGSEILPVDSEHSAIFQCLRGERAESVDKLIITASGGPFRGKTRSELEHVVPADALAHPTWDMGAKITIDSATLVNKGLEVMEARWLFDMPVNKIDVLVQPQSIVHSLVAFTDGSVMAQLGIPDMRIPIQYALSYPERRSFPAKKLDLASVASLTFYRPDTETFPGIPLALRAAGEGGTMPAVFNAANEEAVERFLAGKIRFFDIYEIISFAMDRHRPCAEPDLEEILAAEAETRAMIRDRW